MEYFEHASDQIIFQSGLSRAGYKRAYEKQQRLKRETERREANTVPGQVRYDNSQGTGVPLTKLKWKEQIRAETEAKAQELYQRIMLYRQAKIPINHLMGELANVLGYSQGKIHEFVEYVNSEQCRLRFGGE